jgi:hypothetical protein
MTSIYNLTEKQLLSGISSAPGRVRNFLLNPEQGTMPASCTLLVWNSNLPEMLDFICKSLKYGSGVKIVFDSNLKFPKRTTGSLSVRGGEIEILNNTTDATALKFIEKTNSKSIATAIRDSLEGSYGIIDCMGFLCDDLSKNFNSVYDFSNLRPAGTTNSNGLKASGFLSFFEIFLAIENHYKNPNIETLIALLGIVNYTLRRGGYKKGIITSSMSMYNEHFEDYCNLDISEVAGSHKKSLRINEDLPLGYVELVNKTCNEQSTFLEKIDYSGYFYNVCVGLKIKNRGTCLIWRVNLAMCEIKDIVKAGLEAAERLCELQFTWRNVVGKKSDIFNSLTEDKQIGLDIMGLANLLARYSVSYKDFNDALHDVLSGIYIIPLINPESHTPAIQIASAICEMYKSTTEYCQTIARQNGIQFDYIHTVEPAQEHSYTTKSLEDDTTCRGIWPPKGQFVNRNSATQKSYTVYHGDVEIITETGVTEYWRLNNLWMQAMKKYGLPHAISMDWYEECNETTINDFLKSNLNTKYYSEHTNYSSAHLQKIAGTAQIELPSCGLRPGECRDCS